MYHENAEKQLLCRVRGVHSLKGVQKGLHKLFHEHKIDTDIHDVVHFAATHKFPSGYQQSCIGCTYQCLICRCCLKLEFKSDS